MVSVSVLAAIPQAELQRLYCRGFQYIGRDIENVNTINVGIRNIAFIYIYMPLHTHII